MTDFYGICLNNSTKLQGWNYLELNGMLNGIWDFMELFGAGDAS